MTFGQMFLWTCAVYVAIDIVVAFVFGRCILPWPVCPSCGRTRKAEPVLEPPPRPRPIFLVHGDDYRRISATQVASCYGLRPWEWVPYTPDSMRGRNPDEYLHLFPLDRVGYLAFRVQRDHFESAWRWRHAQEYTCTRRRKV